MKLLILSIAIALLLGLWFLFKKQRHLISPKQPQISNYSIAIQSRINQPDFYPIDRVSDLLGEYQPETLTNYQPIAPWMGRLILPPSTIKTFNEDAIRFEVYFAPTEHQHLIGKIVDLTWSDRPEVRDFVRSLTRDIRFNRETEISQNMGYVLPDRLNGRHQVGPIESLAGARTLDDLTVMLELPVEVQDRPRLLDRESGGDRDINVTLTIDRPPVQISGYFVGLVSIINRIDPTGDRFEVRHYNRLSQQFDGDIETLRIPQVIADRNGLFRSTIDRLEQSPFNASGWYIYGAKDVEGTFVVRAIEPRTLTNLIPDEIHLGFPNGLDYIDRLNWQNTEAQKGTIKTVLLDPTASSTREATADWKEGDKALLVHVYGGIGGNKAEATAPFGIVTGHFAYGIARVIRDAFTDQLRFDINYWQVYAHNPDGIISGTATWANYMGDLQRGWLGSRPVSDVLIKLDCVTEDYNFDGIHLSPLAQLQAELEAMMARYRHGDGDGAALVTPVTSCVQDSNQALYVAIQRIEQQVARQPQILDWLRSHPTHPQTLRFQRLQALGTALEKLLVPLGIVRPDWERNARQLAGITPEPNIFRALYKTATSWRTMLPRFAYDEIARVFLKHGAKLWFLRTNQVGGFDADIVPKAPTKLLG